MYSHMLPSDAQAFYKCSRWEAWKGMALMHTASKDEWDLSSTSMLARIASCGMN
jgi:hypothetical protein